MELKDILARLGSDILLLSSATRNIAEDYDMLVKLLNIPQHKEPMKISDRLIVEKIDKFGNIIETRDSGWSNNGITNAGFATVAGLILTDVGGTPFDFIAIGMSSVAFSPTQTALGNELFRKAASGSRVTISVPNDTAQLITTYSKDDGLSGTSAIVESGVFNASSGGVMLCRQTFAVLNLNWDAGDSLQVTWRIQIKQGT